MLSLSSVLDWLLYRLLSGSLEARGNQMAWLLLANAVWRVLPHREQQWQWEEGGMESGNVVLDTNARRMKGGL